MKNSKQKLNKFKVFLSISFILSLFITVIIFLLVDTKDNAEIDLIRREKIIEFNEGWTLENGQISNTTIHLPSTVKNFNGDGVIISKFLPQQIDPDTELSIRLKFYYIQAFINGKEIYRNANDSITQFGDLNSNVYNSIPISQNYAGEKITLIITSPYHTNILRIPTIKFGLSSFNFLNILKENIFINIFCIITFILGDRKSVV